MSLRLKKLLAAGFIGSLMFGMSLQSNARSQEIRQGDEPWEEGQDLEQMGHHLRELFGDFLNKEAGELRRTAGQGFYQFAGPAVDVFETGDELIVQCDVPGFEKKDVEVELLHNVLTIRGKKEPVSSKRQYFVQERWHESFEKKVPLPRTVLEDTVRAEQVNGVLSVHFKFKSSGTPSVKVAVS